MKTFFFGLHLFLVRKRVPPRNPAPGATIFSNASGCAAVICFTQWPTSRGAESRTWARGQLRFERFFRSKVGDLQKKRVFTEIRTVSEIRTHADVVGLLMPMGPLKSMGPGFIVPPAPLSVALPTSYIAFLI